MAKQREDLKNKKYFESYDLCLCVLSYFDIKWINMYDEACWISFSYIKRNISYGLKYDYLKQ